MAQFKGIGELWQRTTLLQRVLLMGILLACLGACVLLVGWARQPNLSLLYSNLAPAEASKIVEKITESGTPYQIRDGGASVYVPDDKVYALRLTMAQQGLPSGDQAGYRILDEEKIGVSPFTQHVNYTRALEGELAKTIRLIEGVSFARVHIVCPEKTLFARGEKTSSATVVVKLKPSARMLGANVSAIVHLLAGSVEGLSPDKVVVVDGQGNLLSGDAQNEFAKGAGTFLDYKSRVEQYLGRKAEEMLTAVLGPGKASVRVDVTMDTSSISSRSEKVDPVNKTVSKETIKSTSTSGGPAGGAANKEESTDSTYQVSKIVEEKADLPGKIKTKTVAAFVDLTPPEKAADAKGPATAALTPKDVEDIIRNAIGMTTEDTLKVVNTQFYKTADLLDTKTEDAGFMNKDFLLDMARRVSLGVLVIGVLVALKIFGGGKKKGAAPVTVTQANPAGANMLPAAGEGEIDPQVLRNRITRALQDNPEDVKQLFLGWVGNEKGGA